MNMGPTLENTKSLVAAVNQAAAGQNTTQASTTANPTTPLMPDPLDAMAMGDDAIAQITALLAKSYRQDRKDSRKLAMAEEKLCAEETAKRVRAMHQKADAIRQAGVREGVSQIASGCVQIDGALSDSETKKAVSKGLATGYEGIGKIGAGISKADADDREADAAEHEGNAETAKKRAERHRDDMADAKRMLEKVADFLKEIRSSQNASASAAIRRV